MQNMFFNFKCYNLLSFAEVGAYCKLNRTFLLILASCQAHSLVSCLHVVDDSFIYF